MLGGDPNNIGRPPIIIEEHSERYLITFPPGGPCNTDECVRKMFGSGQCYAQDCVQQLGWLMTHGSLRRVGIDLWNPELFLALGGLAFAGGIAAEAGSARVFSGLGGKVAANSVRTFGEFGAADIRAAAGAADRGGLSRVGRALQKHSDREGSVFGGLSSGNPIARNEQGMRVLDEILQDPGSTTQVLDNVTNIWDSTGRGIRLSNDGTFMGFLEPLP